MFSSLNTYVDKFKRLLYVESNAEMLFPPKK